MNEIIEKSFNDFESAKVFVSQLSREDANYYKLNVHLYYQYCEQEILLEGFNHSEKIKEVFFSLNVNNSPQGKIILKDCLFGNLIIKNNFRSLFFVNSKSIKNTKISLTQNNPQNNIDNKLCLTIENTESDRDLSLEICSEYFLHLNQKFTNIENSNFNKVGEILIESPEVKFNNCNFLQKVNVNIKSSFGNKIFYNCVFHGDIALKNLNKLTKNTPFFFKKGTIQSNMFSIADTNVDFSEVDFTGSRLYVEKSEEEKVDGYGLITIPNKLNFKSCKNLDIYLSYGNSLSIENIVKNDNIYNKIYSRFGLNKIELNDCEITDFTLIGEIIDKAIFNNVTFTNPPEIGDIKFKNCNVEFRDIEFKDKKSPEAIAGFRALNKACRDANYHHGEIFFHGLELETRFNMLIERSYLFKFFLFLKGFFLKNIKPVNSNNGVEKINNISNGDNNIRVIQPNTSKTYINVINSIKDFLSIFLRKILIFLKKNFQLIANFFQSKLVYFIKYISYFIISFFIISKDGIERFLLSFHRLFSDFGRSLLLPLFCLVVISIFVWGLNFIQINSSKNITEDLINNECEIIKINVNELPKINSKIVFKNAIGPLQLALPKDFISDCESKFYNQNPNSIIYFLNFFHAVISSGIWFIWFFMIRARFKL